MAKKTKSFNSLSKKFDRMRDFAYSRALDRETAIERHPDACPPGALYAARRAADEKK